MALTLHGNNGVITTNGTAAAPSIAAPDNDTGLYFGTNLIHATAGGSEKLRIHSTGQVEFKNGSFSNNVNSIMGVSSNLELGATATLILRTATNERLRITSTGLVGIGENTPTSLLHLKRSSTTAYSSSATNNDNTIYLINEGAGGHASIQFQTVSGGTSNTGQANINVFCEGNSAKNTAIAFGTRGASGNPAERLRIDSTGRVGIGTNNPSVYSNLAYNLVVRTTGNTGMTLRSGSTSSGSILFASADNSTSNEGIFQYKHNDKAFEFNNYGGGAEKFIYKIQGTEKLRIDSAGRLLVGHNATVDTSTYNSKIQVMATDAAASVTVGRFGDNASASSIHLTKSRASSIGSHSSGDLHDNDGIGNIFWWGSDGGDYEEVARIGAEADAAFTTSSTPGALTFWTTASGATTGTERLRLHSSGKLSVGTTSAGYGQWSFVNVGSSGADATGGETGLTIRSDEGFTNTDVTGNDNWTLKLRNNAYSGGGVSGNQGTVSKILFAGVTSNGHNSYVNIGCDTRGTGGSKGDFFVTTGGGGEKLRILAGGEVLIGGRNAWAGSDLHPNDINRLVVVGTSPADAYDSQCHLEGSETSGAANTGGALAFAGHDGSNYRNWANIYGMKENGTGGNTASYMAFHTRAAGGSPAEKMRITSAGKVGLGTHDPDYMLHLMGSVPAISVEDTDGSFGFCVIEQNNDNFKIRADAGNASSGTGSNISLEVDSFQKMKIHGNYTGTVDIKGIPAHLRLYSQRDTSDWDANDEIGKLEFYVGDDASNNLPYTTNFIKSINTADNKNEPDGALVFGSCRHDQSGGAQETMRLSHDQWYDDHAHLQTQGAGAVRDVYNMMNIGPDGSFDRITNNSDGGGTTWTVQNGTTIRLYNSSGGHGGEWGRGILLRQAGWYYWRMCVRVTTTCTYIHSSTATNKYKYPIGLEFKLHGSGTGATCTARIWNEFATTGTCNGSQSGTGSLAHGTMVVKTGHPVYLPKSTYQPIYHTNGYQGVRELNIYSLDLVQCGSTTSGAEDSGY